MIILGIDPGPEQSWWLKWDAEEQKIISKGIFSNTDIPVWLQANVIVVEDIQYFGMSVGREVFQTAVAIGRILENAESKGISTVRVYRQEIKLHFCNSTKAKDSNIRQVIIDRFGGKEKAIGYKKNPGVLYEIKKHLWSALALCLWYDVEG